LGRTRRLHGSLLGKRFVQSDGSLGRFSSLAQDTSTAVVLERKVRKYI
jgi:hypothetical protein